MARHLLVSSRDILVNLNDKIAWFCARRSFCIAAYGNLNHVLQYVYFLTNGSARN
jgi:hypothetical protein